MRKCLIIEKRGPWVQNTERRIQMRDKEIEIPSFMLETRHTQTELTEFMQRNKRRYLRRRRAKRIKIIKEVLLFLFCVVLGLIGFWSCSVLLIILLG